MNDKVRLQVLDDSAEHEWKDVGNKIGDQAIPIEEQSPLDISSLATSANQTNGSQQIKIKETVPTDGTKVNSSIALSYTSGNLTKIEKTIGAVTYEKVLTWTDGVLTAVSAWSVV